MSATFESNDPTVLEQVVELVGGLEKDYSTAREQLHAIANQHVSFATLHALLDLIRNPPVPRVDNQTGEAMGPIVRLKWLKEFLNNHEQRLGSANHSSSTGLRDNPIDLRLLLSEEPQGDQSGREANEGGVEGS